MKAFLSDDAHKDIEKLYDRRVYLTNDTFCQSFVFFCKRMASDFSVLESGGNRYVIKHGYRISTLSAIQVTYRIVPYANSILIQSIGFVGLRHMRMLCSLERRSKAKPLGRRPSNINASISISDYKDIPNNSYGGEIKGFPVKIVQRKGITAPSGQPIFNYLCNGRIIGKIDFVSCNPFEMIDGVEKANAYGVNGKRYWVLPNGRRLLYCSKETIKAIITETINNYLKRNLLLVS